MKNNIFKIFSTMKFKTNKIKKYKIYTIKNTIKIYFLILFFTMKFSTKIYFFKNKIFLRKFFN